MPDSTNPNTPSTENPNLKVWVTPGPHHASNQKMPDGKPVDSPV